MNYSHTKSPFTIFSRNTVDTYDYNSPDQNYTQHINKRSISYFISSEANAHCTVENLLYGFRKGEVLRPEPCGVH